MAQDAPVDVLILVLDAAAESWSSLDTSAASSRPTPLGERRSSFNEALAALQAFLAAFLSLSRRNALAVLAYNGRAGGYVWPPPDYDRTSDLNRIYPLHRAVRGGSVALRNDTSRAQRGADDPARAAGGSRGTHASLAACMTSAVCYHNRCAASHRAVRSRMLVAACGGDDTAQYVPIMNAAFSAHRLGVVVDAISLGEVASTSLQQACFIAKGTYTHPPPATHAALLQHLIMLYLPDVALRGVMLLPPETGVDLRATCFCHHTHQSIAWVCTICLSVFCAYAAVCTTCGASALPPPAKTAATPAVKSIADADAAAAAAAAAEHAADAEL